MGANIDRMEYFTIASTGAGTDAGNLSEIQNGVNATNGDSRYVINGGYGESGYVQGMTYNDFSTSANASVFGNLSGGSNGHASVCSTSRAVFNVPVVSESTIEYVTVASTGNSADFGDLDNPRANAGGASDGVTGEFYGGNDNVGGGHFSINFIDKITIGTTGNATDIGDLLENNRSPGATSGV